MNYIPFININFSFSLFMNLSANISIGPDINIFSKTNRKSSTIKIFSIQIGIPINNIFFF
ncbi:hypothetical protein KSP39_PZI016412 [Platanthera zijinensis]|uniref:Uncharacterized protein n=1 Tax=Platanthera zijinensis TaxID=2320716 RepID=A0AAP0G156_9ASPA